MFGDKIMMNFINFKPLAIVKNIIPQKKWEPIHEEVLEIIEDIKSQDVEYLEEEFDFILDILRGTKEQAIASLNNAGMPINNYNIYQTILDDESFQSAWSQVYLRGNCYFFAKTLSSLIPGSTILFREGIANHAIVEVEGVGFDARGVVSEDIRYYEGSTLSHMFAECWSFDAKILGPSAKLYPSALKQIVEQPYEELVSLGNWADKVAAEEVIRALEYSFYVEDPEWELAERNGWVERVA